MQVGQCGGAGIVRSVKIGMVGLGRMGGNMAERLRRSGHEVVGFDRNPDIADVKTLAELVQVLPPPRITWVMVPAGEDSVLSSGQVQKSSHPWYSSEGV